jgi:hypothetical protein
VVSAAVAPATYFYGAAAPVYTYTAVTYGPKNMPEGYIHKVDPVPPKLVPALATYGSVLVPGYYYYPRF